MTQRSYFWGGTTTGDAALANYGAPYSDLVYSRNLDLLHGLDKTSRGVLYYNDATYDDCLAVSNPAGSTIRVAPGLAMVNGHLFENTANVDLSAAALANGTYYCVLRCDYTLQTVRAALVSSLTQDVAFPPTTYWDLALATVVKAAGPTYTLTDTRYAAHRGPVLIDEVVVAAGGSTIAFTAIPGIFRHLRLVGLVRAHNSGASTGDYAAMQFNGDVAANYGMSYNYWDGHVGGGAGSYFFSHNDASSEPYIAFISASGSAAGYFAPLEVLIPSYRNTSAYKQATGIAEYYEAGVVSIAGQFNMVWLDTSAITSILLYTTEGANTTFAAGSVVSLYGLP